MIEHVKPTKERFIVKMSYYHYRDHYIEREWDCVLIDEFKLFLNENFNDLKYSCDRGDFGEGPPVYIFEFDNLADAEKLETYIERYKNG